MTRRPPTAVEPPGTALLIAVLERFFAGHAGELRASARLMSSGNP